MAKTLHPACALVGYSVITAIVFTGLLASPFSMFVAVSEPKCMDGTTSTPYPFTLNTVLGQLVPTPPTVLTIVVVVTVMRGGSVWQPAAARPPCSCVRTRVVGAGLLSPSIPAA